MSMPGDPGQQPYGGQPGLDPYAGHGEPQGFALPYPPQPYPAQGYAAQGYPPVRPGNPYAYPPVAYGPPPLRTDARPGSLTAGAVLGYVAGGLIIFAGILLFLGSNAIDDLNASFDHRYAHLAAELRVDGVVNFVAAGLLIAGGVSMSSRTSSGRILYCVGTGVVLAESVYWITRFHHVDETGFVFYSLIFAALVIVGVSLSWTRGPSEWLARRSQRQ
jgi:hypothetical protein